MRILSNVGAFTFRESKTESRKKKGSKRNDLKTNRIDHKLVIFQDNNPHREF